jgi:hypothetical protein
VGLPQTDFFDDVVISAMNEPDGTTNNVGRAYAFELGFNGFLSGDATRLNPANTTQPDQQVGTRGIAIGKMLFMADGTIYNRVWIGAFRRDAGRRGQHWVGAIDVYVLNGNLNERNSVLTVTPPDEPSGPSQGTIVPDQDFGYSIVIADVDGDSKNEPIVGAPRSDGEAGRDVAKGSVIKQLAGAAVHLKQQ